MPHIQRRWGFCEWFLAVGWLSLAATAYAQDEAATPSPAPDATALDINSIFDLDSAPVPPTDVGTTSPGQEAAPASPASGAPAAQRDPARRGPTPTPFVVDPECPPMAIPPLALLPTPSPAPTPSPTEDPLPLPPNTRREDFYSPPEKRRGERPPEPFFETIQGLRSERNSLDAEVEIINEWKRLCAEIILTLDQVSKQAADEKAPSREVKLLLRPGEGEKFLLPAGRWRAVLRAWEPDPPYPERITEYAEQELLPRGRVKATLLEVREREYYKETHPIVVEYRETRERLDPLSALGKPTPTPDPYGPPVGRLTLR